MVVKENLFHEFCLLLSQKNWLTGKDPDAGKDWRQEEKQTTEDETVGWNHQLDGHEFEQAPGVGDGQGSLACCSPWGHKGRTQLSNWTELNWTGWFAGNLWHSLAYRVSEHESERHPSVHGIPRQEYWSGWPSLHQRIFLTQGSNPSLLLLRQIPHHLSHQGSSGLRKHY